jgi:hypothetical protein
MVVEIRGYDKWVVNKKATEEGFRGLQVVGMTTRKLACMEKARIVAFERSANP